jgi:hypothetical protein
VKAAGPVGVCPGVPFPAGRGGPGVPPGDASKDFPVDPGAGAPGPVRKVRGGILPQGAVVFPAAGAEALFPGQLLHASPE